MCLSSAYVRLDGMYLFQGFAVFIPVMNPTDGRTDGLTHLTLSAIENPRNCSAKISARHEINKATRTKNMYRANTTVAFRRQSPKRNTGS